MQDHAENNYLEETTAHAIDAAFEYGDVASLEKIADTAPTPALRQKAQNALETLKIRKAQRKNKKPSSGPSM